MRRIRNKVTTVMRGFMPIAAGAIALTALALAGCGGSSDDSSGADGAAGTDRSPILIAAGNRSTYDPESDEVIEIDSEGALRMMYRKITGKEEMIWPSTDFSARKMYGIMLPAVKGGESVDVYRIEQEDGAVVIHAQRAIAGPKCKSANKEGRPWSVYETRKFTGKPRLEIVEVEGSSCD